MLMASRSRIVGAMNSQATERSLIVCMRRASTVGVEPAIRSAIVALADESLITGSPVQFRSMALFGDYPERAN